MLNYYNILSEFAQGADDFVQKNISTFVVTYNSGLADIVK
jgi:hypothetical protein